MTVTARKYNPGFLSDDELVASFCVRTGEFASMVEVLRDSTGKANTHQIVIGPRGSGKTSLLLRVAAEIRRDADLSSRFFPIVFAEESYEVSTAGEFWLECLSRLADQAPRGEDGPDLRRTYDELRQIRDDRTLGDRCLGVLQDFADREGRRLVMLVENLNMMFRDIADDDAGWRLRQTLQNDPRFLLLASATSRFDEIDKRDRAFYDLFRVVALRPLDTDGCAALWRTVSGRERAKKTIRALQILTGGSPRLLTIVARFGGKLSFRELMADLLDLVDDHTEYFKSHLETLAAQERRVYLALADLWKPATTREIAERARLDTSKCSAHLARLTERGAVEVAGGSKRRKLYYLAERLYNIYYLMRRARGPAPMIEALIRFMEGWYSPDELKEFGARLAREATGFDAMTLSLGRTAFARLVELPSLAAHRDELLSLAPFTFAGATGGLASESAELSAANEIFREALALTENSRAQEALDAWDKVLRHLNSSDVAPVQDMIAIALFKKGDTLAQMNRSEDGFAFWDEVVQRFGSDNGPITRVVVALSLIRKGFELAQLNRPEESVEVLDEVVRRFGPSESPQLQEAAIIAVYCKCVALVKLNQLEQAVSICNEILNLNQNSATPHSLEIAASALIGKGTILVGLNRPDEASGVWDEVIQRFETSDIPLVRDAAETAMFKKAAFELTKGRAKSAVAAASRVLEQEGAGLVETRWRGHLIRARAHLTEGNNAACAEDVEAVLATLPNLNPFPKDALDGLIELAVELGLEQMRDLIVASAAADLLLPLTTALELELGLEPRVAREVEEVAEDIRRDLAERRKAKSA